MASVGPTTLNGEPELPSAFGEIFSDVEKLQTKPREDSKKNDLQSLADTERLSNRIKFRKWKNHASRIKERTYDVNLTTTNMLPYDPLADEHLQDYFNSPHTRDHLIKLGLIDPDGNIIDEKKFKKNQIQLDKKAHEEKILGQQLERELDHDIEVVLRMQARKTTEKRNRLQQPGEGIPEHIVAKYPVSMQKTALIYTASNPLHSTEAALLNRLKDQSPSKLAALGTNKKQVQARLKKIKERRSHTAPSTHHEKPLVLKNLSLVALFEQAKREYQAGKLKSAEENLRTLLKNVAAKTVPSSAKIDTDDEKKTSRKITRSKRPKSARPTRNSAFPVSSAFSECDSDGEVEFEEDSFLEDLESLDITPKTIKENKKEKVVEKKEKVAEKETKKPPKTKSDTAASSRVQSRSQSRAQSEISISEKTHKRATSAQKKPVTAKTIPANPKSASQSKEALKSAQTSKTALATTAEVNEKTVSGSNSSAKTDFTPESNIVMADLKKEGENNVFSSANTPAVQELPTEKESNSNYNDDFESPVVAAIDNLPVAAHEAPIATNSVALQNSNDEPKYEEDFTTTDVHNEAVPPIQNSTPVQKDISTSRSNISSSPKNTARKSNDNLAKQENNSKIASRTSSQEVLRSTNESKSARNSSNNLKNSVSNIASSQSNISSLPRAPSVKFADEVQIQGISGSNKDIYQSDFEPANTNAVTPGELNQLGSDQNNENILPSAENNQIDTYADEFEADGRSVSDKTKVQHEENLTTPVVPPGPLAEKVVSQENVSSRNSRPASARNSVSQSKNSVNKTSGSTSNLEKVSGKSAKASASNLKNFSSLNELNTAKKTKLPDSAPLSRNASEDKKIKGSQNLASSKKPSQSILNKDTEKIYSSAADLVKAQKAVLPPSAPMSRAGSNLETHRVKSENNLAGRSNSKGQEIVDRVTKKESIGNLIKSLSKPSTPKSSHADLLRAKDVPLPGSAPLSRHGSTTLKGVKEEKELEKSEEFGSKDIIYSSVGQGEDGDMEKPSMAETTPENLSKAASTGKLDKDNSVKQSLSSANKLEKSGSKKLSNIKSADKLASTTNLNKTPSHKSLGSSRKDISEKGAINSKSSSSNNKGSMDIIRSTVDSEEDKANPVTAESSERTPENTITSEAKPSEPQSLPAGTPDVSHTPELVNSDTETTHIIPKPKRNVLELNDSTVGRSRSVRSSMSRKPMRGIEEKENEEQAAT
ncbi:hypothetical protein HDV06_006458 [Boothiomyces sp. JEL0866]|nr:hypothetical protein HDV06_001239 [Boothiomyces sp. JEL0866]KAJ3324565.1 hypothetical protein HDV06_006458 [Boothiomyces sp. JEL0866]